MVKKHKQSNNVSTTALSKTDKHTLVILGLPSFGLALAVTVIVTFVPLIAHHFTNSTAIVGLLIASEGVVAFLMPVVVGSYSDHLRTRIGGRLPFIIAGLPIAVATMILIGFATSLLEIIICIFFFFVGYYLMYEPYRALYPDLVQTEAAGRAQSLQAVWRGAGTGLALAGGGFLIIANNWLPFVVSAAVFTLSTLLFIYILLKRRGVPHQEHKEFDSILGSYKRVIVLLKANKELRNFMVMNSLWELTLAALKSFIILYMTIGLGHDRAAAAELIGAVSVVMLIAAPIAGKLGDTYGQAKISSIAALFFGVGLIVPGVTTNPWFIIAIAPIAACGGAIVMTLPFALMMPMMPENQHGHLTGLYSTSRGIGIMLGPILAGIAISLGKHVFVAKGYGGMWIVCGASMLLSLYPLSRLRNSA